MKLLLLFLSVLFFLTATTTETTKLIQPFVIIHPGYNEKWMYVLADVIGRLPIYSSITKDATTASKLWLYGTRTAEENHIDHWNKMWNFQCGRTLGRWPYCGHSKKPLLDLDPHDPTTPELREWTKGRMVHGFKHSKKPKTDHHPVYRHQRPIPEACGFGLNMGMFMEQQQQNLTDLSIIKELLAHQVKIIVLMPSVSAVMESLMAMNDGVHPQILRKGAEAAHKHQISTWARPTAHFRHPYDGLGGLFLTQRHQIRRSYHNLYCSLQDKPTGGTGVTNLISVIRGQKVLRQAMVDMSAKLSAIGFPVCVINNTDMFFEVQHTLRCMYDFLLPISSSNTTTNSPPLVVSPEIQSILSARMAPHPDMASDCKHSFESAKNHFAVEDAKDSLELVEDITHWLVNSNMDFMANLKIIATLGVNDVTITNVNK